MTSWKIGLIWYALKMLNSVLGFIYSSGALNLVSPRFLPVLVTLLLMADFVALLFDSEFLKTWSLTILMSSSRFPVPVSRSATPVTTLSGTDSSRRPVVPEVDSASSDSKNPSSRLGTGAEPVPDPEPQLKCNRFSLSRRVQHLCCWWPGTVETAITKMLFWNTKMLLFLNSNMQAIFSLSAI